MSYNLCRLCLGDKDLMWIFNDRMADNMQEIIDVTSGVMITKSDTVTQMVCSTCCQITIKMFKFRTTSIKNDKDLKAKCAAVPGSDKKSSIPTERLLYNTSPATDIKPKLKPFKVISSSNAVGPTTGNFQIPQKYKSAHPSLKKIIRQYPNIKFPQLLPLKSHFEPYITLLTDEVDEWYKEKNYSECAIQNIKRRVFHYAMNLEEPVAPKKRRISTDVKTESVTRTEATLDCKSIATAIKDKKIHVINEVTVKPVTTASEESTGNTGDRSVKQHNSPKIALKPKPLSCDKETSDDKKIRTYPGPFKIIRKINNEGNNAGRKEYTVQMNTESSTESNAKLASDLRSLLEETDTSKINDKDITLGSMLQTSKSVEEKNVTNKEDNPPSDGEQLIEVHCIIAEKESPKIINESTYTDKSKNSAVLSDSDDGPMSSNNDVVQEDDSSNTTHSRIPSATEDSIEGATRKRDFVRSLNLTPKYGNNTPDFSLLSTNKMNMLYRCTICDSHFTSPKELSKHCRKTHSKCPVCHKKFRNMKIREEHIRTRCSKSITDLKLKNPKLDLVRIDEVDEIRNKYPKAFENFEKVIVITEIDEDSSESLSGRSTSPDTDPPEPFPQLKSLLLGSEVSANEPKAKTSESELSAESSEPKLMATSTEPKLTATSSEPKLTATSSECKINTISSEKPDETENAVRQIQRYLESENCSSPPRKPDSSIQLSNDDNASATAESSTSNPDVICISDDESESSSQQNVGASTAKKLIKVTKNDMLKNINLQDSDVGLVQSILQEAVLRKSNINYSKSPDLQDNNIMDGGTSKIKIFKNLRKYLQFYKIPVEISHSSDLKVNFKHSATPPPKRTLRDIWTKMTPEDLLLSRVPAQQKPENSSQRPSGLVTIASKTAQPQASNSPRLIQPKVKNTVVSSSTPLFLAPNPPAMSTARISNTLTTNNSVLLQGRQNMYVSSGSSSYANILITVPTSMVTARPTSVVSSLPTIQGPLPVIQSVVSQTQLETSPSTNSNSSLPSNQNQPSIRVRTISELS